MCNMWVNNQVHRLYNVAPQFCLLFYMAHYIYIYISIVYYLIMDIITNISYGLSVTIPSGFTLNNKPYHNHIIFSPLLVIIVNALPAELPPTPPRLGRGRPSVSSLGLWRFVLFGKKMRNQPILMKHGDLVTKALFFQSACLLPNL